MSNTIESNLPYTFQKFVYMKIASAVILSTESTPNRNQLLQTIPASTEISLESSTNMIIRNPELIHQASKANYFTETQQNLKKLLSSAFTSPKALASVLQWSVLVYGPQATGKQTIVSKIANQIGVSLYKVLLHNTQLTL